MKKTLVFGGTWFIGRVLVELLLAEGGYDITLFHRGETGSHLFPEVRRIQGDRETDDFRRATEEEWDVVYDLCGYYPKSLEKLAASAAGKVGRYIYVSTVAAYPLRDAEGLVGEDFPLRSCTPEQAVAEPALQFYGEKKAECERVLVATDDLDVVVVRPSIVYGRYDYLERHYHWMFRVEKNREILLPDDKGLNSYTYVDDLAGMMKRAAEVETHRTYYNANTHPSMALREIVEAMARVQGKSPTLVPVAVDFLKERKVQPNRDIPLWTDGDLFHLDNSRAVEDFGLEWTPLEESLARTAAYYGKKKWPHPSGSMTLDMEKILLGQWQGRSS